jgi:hypothetical protein
MKAANRIVTALLSGIIPVTNAFVILLIVTAIYAVIGTHIFRFTSPQYFGLALRLSARGFRAWGVGFSVRSGEWVEEVGAA